MSKSAARTAVRSFTFPHASSDRLKEPLREQTPPSAYFLQMSDICYTGSVMRMVVIGSCLFLVGVAVAEVARGDEVPPLERPDSLMDIPGFFDFTGGNDDILPGGIVDRYSGGLPIFFVENVIVRNLSTWGAFEAGRHGARNVLIENVRNVPRDPPYPNHGFMVNGFYRSTLRNNTITYNLRALELKGGSSLSVIQDNVFQYITPTAAMVEDAYPILYFRPHWGTGEGAYELHFIGIQVAIRSFSNPEKQFSPFRFQQLGGTVENNTFRLSQGRIKSAWIQIYGGEHPTGGMHFRNNTYHVQAARDYSCQGEAGEGLTIQNEDWSGSQVTSPIR